MKYYYLNRIAMAVLVALLLFFGTRTFINIASQEHAPEKPGYDVAGHEKPHGLKEEPAADSGGGGSEVLAMLPDADAAQGEADAALCKICHTVDKGGAALIGPNLYNVVNKDIASTEGFAFTGGLKGKDGDWTYENLDVWLTNPQAFAPGTSMAFPGIPDVKKRANVIAFLRSKADTPAPLPEVSAEEPAADSGGGGSEVLAMLPDADAAQGEADAALCKICHTVDKGGAALIGPNLYNVVNKDIASTEGFAFTGGLKGKDGDWTYENLDVWLTNPQAFAPGTSMAFPGIPDVKKRANVIAFLRSKADTPAPLPEVSAEEPTATSDEPEEEIDEHDDMDGHDDMDASEAMEGTDEMEEPVTVEVIEETVEEILVVPATLSEDAPTEPSMGEDPSASQPQPVYPAEAMEVIEETMETIIVVPAMLSEDAPTESSTGEEPSASQPQPVYPDGGMDDGEAMAPAGDDAPSSQPQPVYPDGMPDGL